MVSTYLVQRGNTEEGIKAALGGLEADVVLKCTGAESPLAAAIFAVRFGGTVFVVGVNLPFMRLSTREIDLKFQYRYPSRRFRCARWHSKVGHSSVPVRGCRQGV